MKVEKDIKASLKNFTISETYKIFYIGKGCGNRIFDHCNDAINEEDESLKLNLISEIIAEGFKVKHYIQIY